MANAGKTNGGPAGCTGSLCDWIGTGKGAQCVDGTGGCTNAHLLEAEESSFHTKELQEATKNINRILSRIPADAGGRKLSFCETREGQFLAWVKHGGTPVKGVTRRDTDKKVARALKLTGK